MNARNMVQNLNGISIAYIMALVNALLSLMLAFGVNMTEQQQATVVAFVNASLVALAHIAHRLGENEQQLKHDAGKTATNE